MGARARKETSLPEHWSEEAYLRLEAQSQVKHEYVNGRLFAMSGASKAHNLISLNLAVALRAHLKGRPCRTYMADVRCHIPAARTYFYPDLMVVCGEDRVEEDTHSDTEPTLIVEVLSPSTDALDWSFKMKRYRLLESLKEYVLVAQDQSIVHVFERLEDQSWVFRPYGEGDDVRLNSVDLTLPVAAIFEDVALPEDVYVVDAFERELAERRAAAAAEAEPKEPQSD